MADGYTKIDDIFYQPSLGTKRTIESIRKRYMAHLRDRQESTMWNLYKQYFPFYQAEEVARSGIKDGSFQEYYDSFKNEYGDGMKALNYLHAALDLNQLAHKKETLAQRTNHFERHCDQYTFFNSRRYQALTLVVGDGVHEDTGLWFIQTTPGLENFVEECLGIDNNTLVGLVKVHAYQTVAKRATAGINSQRLVEEARGSPSGESPSGKEVMSDDNTLTSTTPLLGDENDPLPACRLGIYTLLKPVVVTAGVALSEKKCPWGTMDITLYKLSRVMNGWPAACLFPLEMAKLRNSQGIRGLGNTQGRILLLVLQQQQVHLNEKDQEAICNDEVPIITTADPTSDDPQGTYKRQLYYSGKIVRIGGPAPISTDTLHLTNINEKEDDDYEPEVELVKESTKARKDTKTNGKKKAEPTRAPAGSTKVPSPIDLTHSPTPAPSAGLTATALPPASARAATSSRPAPAVGATRTLPTAGGGPAPAVGPTRAPSVSGSGPASAVGPTHAPSATGSGPAPAVGPTRAPSATGSSPAPAIGLTRAPSTTGSSPAPA
ncbi:hypothetical protein DXG01_004553, partial [Tephrocybe rancida]